MKKNVFFFIFLMSTTVLFVNCKSASGLNLSPTETLEGVYNTTFKNLTLHVSGKAVTGTYESGSGKLQGVLNGNKLSGTWSNSASRKNGKFEFVFSSDFSSFTGKYGYNSSTPSSRWNGKKSGLSSSVAKTSPKQTALPINIMGSWSANGSRNQIGRLHIWQDGDNFVVIASWPDENTGSWKSYKGEGRFEGRQMNFKVFPSTNNGSSADQGYVYHYTISPDNSEIIGYYTRNGQRTVDTEVHYKLVK